MAANEAAQEKERLVVGLVHLTKKILENVSAEISEKVVKDKDLVNEIFREFLFSAVLNSENQNNNTKADNMLELIKSRKPRKAKATAGK